MRTRAKRKKVVNDRARRENVPRHILCFLIGNYSEPLRIRESESSCLHVRDGFSYSQGGSNRVTAPYMSKKKASKKRQTGRRAVFANVWEGF